jgi:Tol biopolymer transport system component
MRMKPSSILLVLATLAVALVSAIPANAIFSGKNGQIVFIQGSSVYKMNSDGSGVQKLTSGAGTCCAAWSPDGKQLVFSAFVNGAHHFGPY